MPSGHKKKEGAVGGAEKCNRMKSKKKKIRDIKKKKEAGREASVDDQTRRAGSYCAHVFAAGEK